MLKLHKESTNIHRTQGDRKRLAANGSGAVAGSPAEFAAFLRAETVKWAAVAKAAKIQAD